MNSAKFIIADDHPLFRNALRQAILQHHKDAEILESDSISSLESCVQQNRDTDLILLDLHMPGANGFSGLVLLRREFPEIPVTVVSASEGEPIIKRALEFGASGFIPKSADLPTIGNAIDAILNGNLWQPPVRNEFESSNEEKEFASKIKSLTPQQLRVFMMLTKGLLNKQIAAEIDVSEATVRTHMTAIFRKLGVRNRTQAVLAAKYLDVDAQELDDN